MKDLKELYSAPEAKMICFVATEKIAADLNFKDYFGISLNGNDQASVQQGDIKI